MNLNQLKYFISVAEHQSFTKAANQFYISQTAITQQIQALETAVDTPLIDRTTRPISLTPSGKTFLIEAKSILRHMDTAIMRTREASKGLMGNIRIGYTKGYEQSNLPKRLRDFHKQYPNILITCYRNDTDMLASGIINKEYDIIFTWDSTDIRQESMLEIHDMETVPLYVAMHMINSCTTGYFIAEMHVPYFVWSAPSGTRGHSSDGRCSRLRNDAYHQSPDSRRSICIYDSPATGQPPDKL